MSVMMQGASFGDTARFGKPVIRTITIVPDPLTRQEREDKLMALAVGDRKPGAEDRLVARFHQVIYAVLVKLTADPTRAEDLTQETLILVIEKLRRGDVEKPHKLTSFVLSIAKFSYFGWLRKKDNQLELRESLGDMVGDYISPEDQIEAEETRSTLERLIDTLPVARDREILQRHYLNQQTKAEICDAMTLTRQHYDRVISRARMRLRENVAMA